jgi:hypothetical protein
MTVETFVNCIVLYLGSSRIWNKDFVEFCFAVLVYVVDWLSELVFLLLVEIRL